MSQFHSLHHYLQREEEINLEILPLGELSKIQLEILLKKNPSLYYPHDTYDKNGETRYPCRIFQIFQRPKEIYGIPVLGKSNSSIKNLFNDYLKISGNQ
jgi:hypothetical protein